MIRVNVAPDLIAPSAYDADNVRFPLKKIPGLRWDAARRGYTGPRHALECAIDMLQRKSQIVLVGELGPKPSRHSGCPVSGLRDHQVAGATWIAQQLAGSRACLLADDMGLGKTAQAIRAVEPWLHAKRDSGSGFVLVICPAIVARHWVDEVNKWSWQGLSLAERIEAKKKQLQFCAGWVGPSRPNFGIITYDLFKRHCDSDLLLGADVVIADEAHYLANSRTKRTAALVRYMAGQRRRPKLLLLTGSPLSNRPRDLHALLDLMHPGDWGSFFGFTKRYCGGQYVEIPNTDRVVWESEGSSHVSELRQRLAHVMLRREKADVAGLPLKIRTTIEVELPARAQKAMREAAQSLDGFKALGRALGNTETSKIDKACELAESIVAQGGKPLIFTTRKETAQIIGERLGCVVVTGNDAVGDRAAKLANAHAAAATMFSLTTGINLTQFDSVIFVGLHWVPSTLLQAENRPHRIGQTKIVNVYYCVALGTVDELIRHRVIERLELFDTAIGAAADGNAMRDELAGKEEDILQSIVELVGSGK